MKSLHRKRSQRRQDEKSVVPDPMAAGLALLPSAQPVVLLDPQVMLEACCRERSQTGSTHATRLWTRLRARHDPCSWAWTTQRVRQGDPLEYTCTTLSLQVVRNAFLPVHVSHRGSREGHGSQCGLPDECIHQMIAFFLDDGRFD